MINGNSVVMQIGKESAYGTGVSATKQFKISSESLKAVYNKIDEGLATGGRGAGLKATMGIGVEGSASTLFRADMGYLLKGALGVENVELVEASTGAYSHTFTCIESAEDKHLPSFTAYVDRKVDKFKYTGCKINSMKLSAASGDYLKCDIDFVGKDEVEGASMNPSLVPSPLRAFKFAQGKVYTVEEGARIEVADITSINLNINNNCDYQTQTTATGDYYKEAEVGTRDISCDLEAIYSAGTEELRKNFYKSDSILAIAVEFISDEEVESGFPYKLTINLPCCQMSDATANMGGLDTLKQSMTLNVADNLQDELIEAVLINKDSVAY